MRSPLFHAAALLSAFLALGSAPAISAPAQPLAIFVHGTAARTRVLPKYDTALPIAVRVAGDARRFDAVTLTATGPHGASITQPLAKSTNGFIGTLRLNDPGTWSLALTTRVGELSGALAAVPVAVATPLGVDPLALALMALALCSVAAGTIVLRAAPRLARSVRKRS